VFNLLDTPGHADFSEDTYRTLCAADAAVMVLDLAKGLEPQTLKLFRVCRDRGLPIVTFVNKCDRPGLPPLAVLDDIATRIGLDPVPLTWPVGDGGDFAGIVDRRADELVRFARTAHGATVGDEHRVALADATPGACPADVWQTALDEVALFDLEQVRLDHAAFLAGRQTPVLFGSALANFGVRLLLDAFAELAPPPAAQPVIDPPGDRRRVDAPFSAQVFKVQANMDPRHRDRIAFLRVNSGRFERGMTATLARSGKPFPLKYSHQVFGRERTTVDHVVAGDIVGVVNATGLRVGDTLYTGPRVTFPHIPSFAPERFVTVHNRNRSRYKQFRTGLDQLDEEGVIQLLLRPDHGYQEPILAGVGQLQFEVAAYRMADEFGCDITTAPAPWYVARTIDAKHADTLRHRRRMTIAENRHGDTLALFASNETLQWAREDHPEIEFITPGMQVDRRSHAW
jgi:peptide chain release factor 3